MSAASDDDDVFDVLQEAQALMEEMGDEEGVDAIVIDGFSIDDVLDDPPIIDARTTATSSTNAAPIKVEVGDDPLSVMTSGAAGGAATDSSRTTSPRRSSLTLHPLTDEQVAPTKATTLTAPSLAEVKARASGFASTISNFAQKAATAAVEAARDNSRHVVQQHQQNQNPPQNQQQNQNQHASSYPMAAPPAHSHAMELDNDQKTALIQQHLGTLLPGERVIMFLPNLLHVSDSSGWELNNMPSDGMWCCCMTFYRVVLFHTGTSTTTTTTTTTTITSTAPTTTASPTTTTTTTLPPPPPEDWDVDCWPVPPTTPSMLQMPLASMDRVEKSIYTTAQNTTLMGLVMYGYVRVFRGSFVRCSD
jgi:hypothetical protein